MNIWIIRLENRERKYFLFLLQGIKSEKKIQERHHRPRMDKIDLETPWWIDCYGSEVNINPQGSCGFECRYVYTKSENPRLFRTYFWLLISIPKSKWVMEKWDKDEARFQLWYPIVLWFDPTDKAGFDSGSFTEDDIIKIEAEMFHFWGKPDTRCTVTLGTKTELQFGIYHSVGFTAAQ